MGASNAPFTQDEQRVHEGHSVRAVSTSVAIMAMATVVLWASAFAGIRVALAAYSPSHLALLRYLIASIALAIAAVATRMRLPRRDDLPGFALIGFAGITVYNIALNYGETQVPAATASFLIASTPIWMAILASMILGERMRLLGWAGIVASFGGVALIALGTSEGIALDPHALVVLAAALASSVYSLGQKPYLRRYGVLECTAYAIWLGTLLLIPFGPGLIESIQRAPLGPTLAVVYMGVFPGALAYVAWAYVLARVPAAQAGSFLYLVPAATLLIGWAWLGEVPGTVSLFGGVLVLAGVLLVNARGR